MGNIIVAYFWLTVYKFLGKLISMCTYNQGFFSVQFYTKVQF